MKILLFSCLLALAASEVYFQDDFSDGDAWESRWIQSKHKDDYGKFKHTAGKIFADEDADKGLQTSQDAKFYANSAKFAKTWSNKDKDLVIQFSVKHEQKIDCGGGYVKVFPDGFEPEDMHGESEYNIMFGPDICGYSTKKVHVIFNYKGTNHLIEKEIKCKDDVFTHVYTLVVKSDNTYSVFIDGDNAQSGSLESDWKMLKAKTIKDPDAKKPEDWVDDEEMDDPEDSKPEDWDEAAEYVSDPDAEIPEDWDEEMDGEWEAPMINNPEFKGEWKPKRIANPDYKGSWVHPEIDNPEYEDDKTIYSFDSFGGIGLDLWQVKSGTVFDNFLISDDAEGAIEVAKEIYNARKDGEKSMQDEIDATAKEAEGGDEDMDDGEEDLEDEDEEDFDEDFDDEDFDHDEL